MGAENIMLVLRLVHQVLQALGHTIIHLVLFFLLIYHVTVCTTSDLFYLMSKGILYVLV